MDHSGSAALNAAWGLALPETASRGEILEALAIRIAYLMLHDEEALLRLLYKIDVPEKAFLEHRFDAGALAGLVYDRQLAKAQLRRDHPPEGPVDPELSW